MNHYGCNWVVRLMEEREAERERRRSIGEDCIGFRGQWVQEHPQEGVNLQLLIGRSTVRGLAYKVHHRPAFLLFIFHCVCVFGFHVKVPIRTAEDDGAVSFETVYEWKSELNSLFWKPYRSFWCCGWDDEARTVVACDTFKWRGFPCHRFRPCTGNLNFGTQQ